MHRSKRNLLIFISLLVVFYLAYGFRFYQNDLKSARSLNICPENSQNVFSPSGEPDFAECKPQVKPFRLDEAAFMTIFWLPLLITHALAEN